MWEDSGFNTDLFGGTWQRNRGLLKKNKIIIISKSTGKDLAAFWKRYIFSILGIFLTFLKEFNYPELSHLISLNTHKRKNSQSKLKVGELCFILLTMRTFKRLENYFLLFWMTEVKDRNDLLDHREHFLDNCGSVSSVGRKEHKFHRLSSSEGQQWCVETLMVRKTWANSAGAGCLQHPASVWWPYEMNELRLSDVQGPGMNSTKSTAMTAPFIGRFGSMAE